MATSSCLLACGALAGIAAAFVSRALVCIAATGQRRKWCRVPDDDPCSEGARVVELCRLVCRLASHACLLQLALAGAERAVRHAVPGLAAAGRVDAHEVRGRSVEVGAASRTAAQREREGIGGVACRLQLHGAQALTPEATALHDRAARLDLRPMCVARQMVGHTLCWGRCRALFWPCHACSAPTSGVALLAERVARAHNKVATRACWEVPIAGKTKATKAIAAHGGVVCMMPAHTCKLHHLRRLGLSTGRSPNDVTSRTRDLTGGVSPNNGGRASRCMAPQVRCVRPGAAAARGGAGGEGGGGEA